MMLILKRFSLVLGAFFIVGLILFAVTDTVQVGLYTMDWLILGILVVALASITTLIMTVQAVRKERQLNVLTSKIDELRLGEHERGPILLRPEDEYFQLAEAINRAQTANEQQLLMLQEQAAALTNLMDNMPIAALDLTTDRIVQRLNTRAVDLLSISPTAVGKRYDNFIRHHAVLTIIEAALSAKQTVRKQIEIQVGDSQVTLDVTVVYYQTSQNRAALLALFYDISDLVALQKMQQTFVANASHELRTPLTAITGFTETLLMGAQEDPEARQEFLTIIDKEAKRLLALTKDILTLAKLPDEQEIIKFVAIRELVADIFLNQAKTASARGIRLKNQVAATSRVKVSEHALQQILQNLIANAVKYNKDDGMVTVSFEENEDLLTLTVSDTGLGIASDEQPRVFERFYRIDKSRNKQIPGTGLGLSIVRDLVEKMNGSVTLRSQVGVGTTIIVEIPTIKNM
jgi:two-component system phosphate regulon sensor histidine kinase PhoR